MLATIVLDAYKYSETAEVAEALDDLLTNNCWSTAGIYCYWNFYTKQALYIGLAVDLHQRFLQHNSLIKANPKTCKSKEIKEYFTNYDKIGFSIMLQSNLSQPLTRKFRKKYWEFWQKADADYRRTYGIDGIQNIRLMEGITIETARIETGILPPWNNMNGSQEGSIRATPSHLALLKLLTNQEFNDNVSRATLRQLNTNSYGMMECFLHGLRITFLPLAKSLEFNRKFGNEWMVDQFLASNYLAKNLILL